MEIFVARQPIFDSKQQIFAYELLFRNGLQNFYDNVDGNKATTSVLNNSFFSIGIDTLTRGNQAFVNFTEKLLLDEVATLFPKEQVAVEVLETVDPNTEVIKNCKNLKKKGYCIVLDDFVFDPKFTALIDLADIIKVDFMNTAKEERKNLLCQINSKKIKFLAEKVETYQDFKEAIELGYCYFQGYFFCKPEIISGKEIPGYKITHLQLLKQLYQPEIDFNKLENIIKQDVSISYKLFKFINSSFFGFSKQIKSIKQALVMLGVKEAKKWVTVIILGGIANDKPDELIITSLLRAKLCESIAEKIGLKEQAPELFLTGLFSLVDAMIDRPKDEILNELPISSTIKFALLGIQNNYRTVLDLIVNYEQGAWSEFSESIRNVMIKETEIPDIFIKSVVWAHQIFSVNQN